MSLQKGNDVVNGFEVLFLQSIDSLRIFRKNGCVLGCKGEQLLQVFSGKKSQNDFNAQVHLEGRNAFGIEETFEVSRCRIGRIELGEGRGDEKEVFQVVSF